jgi:antitoxin MazE
MPKFGTNLHKYEGAANGWGVAGLPLEMYLHAVYTLFCREERAMNVVSVVSKWGNSHALRLPVEITRQLDLDTNDKVFLEVENDKLTITKAPAPKKGTLEYLFKDYSDESFETKLVNPRAPVGEEQW